MIRMVPSTARPRLAPKLRTVCVIPVDLAVARGGARLSASVLTGPRIRPMPAPAMTTQSTGRRSWRSSSALRPQEEADGAAITQPGQRRGASRPACRGSGRPTGRRPRTRRRTTSRKRPACDASSPSEICAYMLAKRNIGTNAHREQEQDRRCRRRTRGREDVRTWISGSRVAQLEADEHGEEREPGDDAAEVAGSSQPHVARLLEAEHAEAHAGARSARRPGSRCGAGWRLSSGFARRYVRTRATIATGTLIQKIARHVQSMR